MANTPAKVRRFQLVALAFVVLSLFGFINAVIGDHRGPFIAVGVANLAAALIFFLRSRSELGQQAGSAGSGIAAKG
jgi:hypothetical protein